MSQMELLGKGIYSLSDASFLTSIKKTKINRWVKGYKRNDIRFGSVIPGDFAPINDQYAISFLDLIELFFINAFMEYGVSLQTIRKAYIKAQEYIGHEHPFSSKRFKTDGKKIIAQVDDLTLINLLNDQFAIKKILDPFLKDVFDFEEDIINRLWPLGKDHQVVIDPTRSFGKPIVDREGVPVEVLYNAFKVENSIEVVGEWYDVSPESVGDAVMYYNHRLLDAA